MGAWTLPKKFSATFVNLVFFPEYAEDELPLINRGRCYDWAYISYCLWYGVKLWSSWRHAWIQVGDKFFDCEAVNGVSSYEELPCNLRARKCKAELLATTDFQNYWNANGGGKQYHWHNLIMEIKSKGLVPLRS